MAQLRQNSSIFNNIIICYVGHFFLFLASIIATSHFFYLFFFGLLFYLFTYYHTNLEYHKLIVNIVTVAIIELVNQLDMFIFISLFIVVNVFFVAKIQTLFASNVIANILYIAVLYFLLFVYFYFQNAQVDTLLNIIIINFFIDALIVGFLC